MLTLTNKVETHAETVSNLQKCGAIALILNLFLLMRSCSLVSTFSDSARLLSQMDKSDGEVDPVLVHP